MNTQQRAVVQQALEALEYIDSNYMSLPKLGNEAITALRQLLEQPEQADHIRDATKMVSDEPVAWMHVDAYQPRNRHLEWKEHCAGYQGDWIKHPLYTRPQPAAWVGLTADEMLEALTVVDPATKRLPIGFTRFAQAIEAKLREKNGAQPAVQHLPSDDTEGGAA